MYKTSSQYPFLVTSLRCQVPKRNEKANAEHCTKKANTIYLHILHILHTQNITHIIVLHIFQIIVLHILQSYTYFRLQYCTYYSFTHIISLHILQYYTHSHITVLHTLQYYTYGTKKANAEHCTKKANTAYLHILYTQSISHIIVLHIWHQESKHSIFAHIIYAEYCTYYSIAHMAPRKQTQSTAHIAHTTYTFEQLP